MSLSLDFELLLLGSMSAEYVADVLEQHQLNALSVATLERDRAIRLPLPIGISIDYYEKILGNSFARHSIPGPATGQQYVRHDFSLELWPHLVWSVATVDGLVFGYGFRARMRPELSSFKPDALMPGHWCLDDLKEMGIKCIQVDGWGEEGLFRFELGELTVDGAHCFGVFHQWKISSGSD